MTDTVDNQERNSGGAGCVDFLKVFIKLMFWLVIIAAIAVAGFYGYQELTRSFDSVEAGIAINARRIDLLRADAGGLMDAAPTAQAEMRAAAQEQAETARNLDAMEEALLADLDEQRSALESLQGQLDVIVIRTETLTGSVAALDSGILLLQEDLNENWATTDQIGGGVDALQGDVALLEEETVRLEGAIIDPGAQLAEMRQILLLFQVWELASRARLHLIDGNAGLAEEDVTAAVRILDALENDENALLDREAAGSLRARLELALGNLPDDARTASGDLELAWDRLDELLTALLNPAGAEIDGGSGDEILVPTATGEPPEATGTPTATPTP